MLRSLASLLVVMSTVGSVLAGAEDFFEAKIRPLFAERCYSCHSDQAKKSKGGLKLDTKAVVFSGGDSGPAVVAGKPSESLLMKAVTRADKAVSAMPPDKPLTGGQIKDIEKWIADGAAFPDANKPRTDPLTHWAFQPVKNPTVPDLAAKDWPRSDVDRFLLAKMDAMKLAPAADADLSAVARRLRPHRTAADPGRTGHNSGRRGGGTSQVR